MKMNLSCTCGLAFTGLLLASAARAAQISGSVGVASTTESSNLTVLGVLDWAFWNKTDSNTGVAAVAPTNRKSGASMIGSITAFSGTELVRGSVSTNKPAVDFTFSNGASPSTGTVENITGIFNTTLNTADVGVQVSITLPTTDTYQVLVWAPNYSNSALTTQLTAQLGDASYSSPGEATGNPKPTYLHTLIVTPDEAGQVLQIRHVLTVAAPEGGDGASHALLSAVAVSLAPPQPPSSPFQVTIAPAVSPATGYDLTWPSQVGKLYNLRTSTDLNGAISTWEIVEGGISPDAPTISRNVASADSKRFYAVEEYSP